MAYPFIKNPFLFYIIKKIDDSSREGRVDGKLEQAEVFREFIKRYG